jgi:tetratricopeptide (TPR) repeat protein
VTLKNLNGSRASRGLSSHPDGVPLPGGRREESCFFRHAAAPCAFQDADFSAITPPAVKSRNIGYGFHCIAYLPQPESTAMPENSPAQRDWLRLSLIALALVYALFAGLRQVNETDLGWQMATGRYILQHRHFPSTTLFTYTVPNSPWLYPPFSGMFFYIVFLTGGYTAISWFSALATAAASGFAMWRGGRLTAALAVIAVPALAFRTVPRADLFTTVLFALVFSLVWQLYQGAKIRLWLFPPLMAVWVNLHPGFVAGLALMGAYVCFEAADLLFPQRRAASLQRIRNFIPCFAASAVATLVNPWGMGIFSALRRQDQATQQLTDFVGEWSPAHFNALALRQFLDPRDPASADWWLMALALLTIALCLWRKKIGPAVLLVAILFESVKHLRFQALLAILVVTIGGAVLPELLPLFERFRVGGEQQGSSALAPRAVGLAGPVLLAAMTLLVSVRSYDLVSNKHYLEAGETTLFGAGESWWFPEKAMAFLEREHLPVNIFHDYNLGGYLTVRIGQTYPDFADGRFVPFAPQVFFEQKALMSAAPDSPIWQQAGQHWNINTLIFSLSRYAGLGAYPLAAYCHSDAWKPVYADDVSIIFLRNRPEYAALSNRMSFDCARFHLPQPPSATGDSWRARAERFNFLMNSASTYYLLARDSEAASALQEAAQLFPNNSNLHLVQAQLSQAENRLAEAEHEYRTSIRLHPNDDGWFALASLYAAQQRYSESEACLRQAISYSQVPYERFRNLGLLYVAMHQREKALAAFDRAEAVSPYHQGSSEPARNFQQRLADARAKALALAK